MNRASLARNWREPMARTKSSVQIPNKMEDVIKCVALFYKAGTSGKEFMRKEKFRMKVRKAEDGKEIYLREFKDLIR